MNKILIATSNQGKLNEFKTLLKELNIEVLSLEEFDKKIEVEEDRKTFLENAIKKAKEYSKFYNLPVISEDAGLEIESLDGYPSIYSARFYSLKEIGGEEPVITTKDKANIKKVIRLMEGKENRKARFVSNVVFYLPDDFGFWTEGYLYGNIADKECGDDGFGYDPIFIPDGYDKTLAQLGMTIKNKISHRAKAVNKLVKLLQKLI